MNNNFSLDTRKFTPGLFSKNTRTFYKISMSKMAAAGNFFYFISLFLCSINTTAQMQQHDVSVRSFYLAASGSDENSGTFNRPWKTIQKINSTLLRCGDTVLFKAGDTFNGTLLLDSSRGGLANKPIMITSYGSGKAVINAGNESAIHVENTKWITVRNLTLIGSGRKAGNTDNGISIMNCNQVIVDDLDISGFRNSGLYLYSSFYIRVTNVVAHDNGFAGISISGKYQAKGSCHHIYVGYCKAMNNPGSPVIVDNHSGNGIVAGNCSRLVIEYCIATNNGWDMPRIGNGPVGIWCYEADSVLIQHCISFRNKTSVGGDDGGGFDLDGGVTNSIIQYCLSYENEGSGFGIFQYAGASSWQGNIIRHNISENDGAVSAAGAGIYIWNGSDDTAQFRNCLVYNNTIFNSKGAAISFANQSKRKDFLFCNNNLVADSILKGNIPADTFLENTCWSFKNKIDGDRIGGLFQWATKSNAEMISIIFFIGFYLFTSFLFSK